MYERDPLQVFDCFHLRVVYERDRTGFEESKEFVIRMGEIIAARYQVVEYLGSAAFSRAIQCLDLHTNTMVCLKIIKNDKDFMDQSLDEIKLLRFINLNCRDTDEENVLTLYDSFYHKVRVFTSFFFKWDESSSSTTLSPHHRST